MCQTKQGQWQRVKDRDVKAGEDKKMKLQQESLVSTIQFQVLRDSARDKRLAYHRGDASFICVPGRSAGGAPSRLLGLKSSSGWTQSAVITRMEVSRGWPICNMT